jgi:L-threonylcarbamoyladenylate synthase
LKSHLILKKVLTTEELAHAVELLRNGGVVVFPTETVYGLAADATNARAVERVMAIKGREGWKTLPLIVADQEMFERYCVITPKLQELTRQFWPGQLTVVVCVKQDSKLASQVVRDGTVAIRVSSHPVARALSAQLGVPLVATSANVAGEPTCYDVASVTAQFSTRPLQPDFYLDAGSIETCPPSTIVAEQDGKIVVLRQGEINILATQKILLTKLRDREV